MAGVAIKAVEPPALIAPAGIWFEADRVEGFTTRALGTTGKVYDPTFHDIHYSWRILGSDPWAFDAPGNMIPDWNDGTRAMGKKVALFFPKPGEYTVELIARDPRGTEARATYPVTVKDTAGQFPGEATLAVSFDPAETWQGAPEGARKIASAKALETAINRSGQPLRILFRRDQTFIFPGIKLGRSPLYHLDAWGTGQPPHIENLYDNTRSLFSIGKGTKVVQFTAANLNLQGHWEPTTESGPDTGSPFQWRRARTDGHYLIWNCRMAGFGMIDVQVHKAAASTVLLGNSTITDWRAFGMLFRSPKARLALSGMAVTQNVQALHGGRLVRSLSNRGGPVRVTACENVYIGTSDFFSRSGWSGLADELADQPCLRLNTSGTPDCFFNVERIVCEGGYHVINMAGANGRVEEHPGNYLIDKALLIATAKTIGPFISNDFGGATFRNVIGILPDVSKRHPNNWQGGIGSEPDNPRGGNNQTPVALYGASFLDLRGDAPDRWIAYRGAEHFETLTVENLALGGFDLSTPIAGVTPRYLGIRYGFEVYHGELQDSIPENGSLVLRYRDLAQDTPARKGTRATDQAYWQAFEDRDMKHVLRIASAKKDFHAEFGQIEVFFDWRNVVIINTSGRDWEAGSRWFLKLDRTSRLEPMDTRFASPQSLPMPYPQDTTPTAGFSPFDDFLGRPRGTAPVKGALQPKG